MAPWDTLGLAPTADERDLKRAYAALIKQFRPDTHPHDFARIREAYEWARVLLRQRADAVEGAGDDASAADAPAAVAPAPDAPAPAAVPDTPPEPIVTVAAAPQPPAAPEADLRERVQAIAAVCGAHGDVAALDALRGLLRETARSHIDARQDLETLLLRAFLGTDEPPLLLVFEAGRAFGWHHRDDSLRHLLTPAAARRLAALLQASRMAVFCRCFSGNRWLQRLYTPGAARLPRGAFNAAVRHARSLAWPWVQRCHAQELTVGPASLSVLAWARTGGALLLSTDVLLGMLLGWEGVALFDDVLPPRAGAWPAAVALLALACTALVAAGRIAARRLRQTTRWAHLVQWQQRRTSPQRWAAGVAAVSALFLGAFGLDAASPWQRTLATGVFVGGLGTVAVAVSITAAALLWRALAMIEDALLGSWLDFRCSLDRLAFQDAMARRPEQEPAPKTGTGAGMARFTRQAPPAWRRATWRAAAALAAQERLQQERPPRQRPWPIVLVKPPAGAGPTGRGGFPIPVNWRWALFIVWVAAQVARLASH